MAGPPGGGAGQWFRGCLGTFFGPILSLGAGSWGSLGVYFRASWRFIFTHFSMVLGQKRASGLSWSLGGHFRAILTKCLKISIFHSKTNDFWPNAEAREPILEPFLSLLKPSWSHLGVFWAILKPSGRSWRHLEAVSSHLGTNFDKTRAILQRSWGGADMQGLSIKDQVWQMSESIW